MDKGRRDIIKSAGMLLGLHTLSPIFNVHEFIGNVLNNVVINDDRILYKDKDGIIYPPLLKENAKVAILAPASPANLTSTTSGRQYLRRIGFEVVLGDTVANQKNNFRYLSAPDDVRAKEFMEFIERDDIDAIICGRGGYGSMRILQMLDYDVIRRNPKIILGFSDITALLLAIYKKSKLITYHGPVASSTFNNFTSTHLLPLIYKPQLNDILSIKAPSAMVINEGYSSGKMVGGNLTIFSALLGTEFEVDTQGSILFLEDNLQNAYEFDRMLNHLLLAGKIQRANAIIFGYFKNYNTRRPFFPNMGYSIKEVIEQLIKPLGIPCMVQMPFGHIEDTLTFPIGANATLDTSEKKLSITAFPEIAGLNKK